MQLNFRIKSHIMINWIYLNILRSQSHLKIEYHLEKGIAIMPRQRETPVVSVIFQMVGQPRAEKIYLMLKYIWCGNIWCWWIGLNLNLFDLCRAAWWGFIWIIDPVWTLHLISVSSDFLKVRCFFFIVWGLNKTDPICNNYLKPLWQKTNDTTNGQHLGPAYLQTLKRKRS